MLCLSLTILERALLHSKLIQAKIDEANHEEARITDTSSVLKMFILNMHSCAVSHKFSLLWRKSLSELINLMAGRRFRKKKTCRQPKQDSTRLAEDSECLPSAGYLFAWAVINDGEGHEVVTLGGDAISKNMFMVEDTCQ